jgi:hypothetical protein
VELILETKQEMPTFLEMMNNEQRSSYPASHNRRGGSAGAKRFGGGSSFASRDYRQQSRPGPMQANNRGYNNGYPPPQPAYGVYSSGGYGGNYSSAPPATTSDQWWD